MQNLRKRVIISSIVAALVCGTSTTADAGVVPWVWNVFFGPADAPWFAPINRPYYAGYAPGYARPGCGLRRRAFAPYTAGYPVSYPYVGGCNTGCASAVSYAPTVDYSYSTYVVGSGCNTGCSVGVSAPVAPVADPADYEAERPAVPEAEATDTAPSTAEEDDEMGESRDEFRAPSSPGESTDENDDGNFVPPATGAPGVDPIEPGARRESASPIFASTAGLNPELIDDTPRDSGRILTRSVRERLAKQQAVRWISAPRHGVARR